MPPILDPLNLVLLVVAAIVFWRLKSVLGTRTGTERPPAEVTVLKPRDDRRPEPTADPNSVTMGAPEPKKPVWHGYAEEGSPVAKGIESLSIAMPGFDAGQFSDGAKRAYEMVLGAFAAGDKAKLKPLLVRELLETFSQAIDQRNAEGSSKIFRFVGVNSARIERVALENKTASLTIRFRSDMIHATRNKNGETVDGDAQAVREVEDIWTFERDVSSRDPNWRLASTDDEIG
jgi:predicted lipid-binding transport protein (Tim44 family)